MSRRALTVLVVGATSKQGMAVIRGLLAHGHVVRALTRRPDGPVALALRSQGVAVMGGDFSDQGSLDRAFRHVDSAFAMTTTAHSRLGSETRDGIALVNAAKAARVRHFVYASVAGADKHTGIPRLESKWRIEQHLASSYVPATILGPVLPMENLLGESSLAQLRRGTLSRPYPAKRPLQQVAAETVGSFAAWALDRGDRFVGQRIDLASDALTGEEEAAILSVKIGRPVQYEATDPTNVEDPDTRAFFAWLEREGFRADLSGLRRDYPEVSWVSFPAWVEQHLAPLTTAV